MKQLQKSLKDGIVSPVYLFYGAERFLIDEMTNELKNFIAPHQNAWNIDIFDGEESGIDEVINALLTIGFFAGRRLVIVKNPKWLAKKAKVEAGEDEEETGVEKSESTSLALLDYLEAPNPDSILLITVNGHVDKRLKLVQMIKKAGRVMEFPALTYKDNEFILERMRNFLSKRGQKTDNSVFEYLTLIAGYDLSFIHNELEKLSAYCAGKAAITLEDAKDIVSRSSMAVVFELSDAMLAKDTAKSIEAYRTLTGEGEPEQKILIILAKQFREVLMVQELANRGLSSADIAKEVGIHPYVAGKYFKSRRNFQPDELLKALEILLSVDIANKNGEGELHHLLEVAIMRICSIAT